jgi:hypothetical protein
MHTMQKEVIPGLATRTWTLVGYDVRLANYGSMFPQTPPFPPGVPPPPGMDMPQLQIRLKVETTFAGFPELTWLDWWSIFVVGAQAALRMQEIAGPILAAAMAHVTTPEDAIAAYKVATTKAAYAFCQDALVPPLQRIPDDAVLTGEP